MIKRVTIKIFSPTNDKCVKRVVRVHASMVGQLLHETAEWIDRQTSGYDYKVVTVAGNQYNFVSTGPTA